MSGYGKLVRVLRYQHDNGAEKACTRANCTNARRWHLVSTQIMGMFAPCDACLHSFVVCLTGNQVTDPNTVQ